MYLGLGADITQTWPTLTVSGYPTTAQLQASNAVAAASLPTASLPTTQSSGALYYDAGDVLANAAAVPACNTLMVPTGTYGPFNCSGDQSQVMTYDPSGNDASVPFSWGVIEDWFLTGNNAIYAGLAVAALAALMAMKGRR
jgi:hypothetical protein